MQPDKWTAVVATEVRWCMLLRAARRISTRERTADPMKGRGEVGFSVPINRAEARSDESGE